jgi:hypothetical protein
VNVPPSSQVIIGAIVNALVGEVMGGLGGSTSDFRWVKQKA